MKYGFILTGEPIEVVELAQEAEAAGWDSAVIQENNPEVFRERKAAIEALRSNPAPLDIITEGETPHDDPTRAAGTVRPYVEVGATWWLESMWELEGVTRNYDMHTHPLRPAAPIVSRLIHESGYRLTGKHIAAAHRGPIHRAQARAAAMCQSNSFP